MDRLTPSRSLTECELSSLGEDCASDMYLQGMLRDHPPIDRRVAMACSDDVHVEVEANSVQLVHFRITNCRIICRFLISS